MTTPQQIYPVTVDALNATISALRPVSEERGGRYPVRDNRGVPPELYGSYEFNSPNVTTETTASATVMYNQAGGWGGEGPCNSPSVSDRKKMLFGQRTSREEEGGGGVVTDESPAGASQGQVLTSTPMQGGLQFPPASSAFGIPQASAIPVNPETPTSSQHQPVNRVRLTEQFGNTQREPTDEERLAWLNNQLICNREAYTAEQRCALENERRVVEHRMQRALNQNQEEAVYNELLGRLMDIRGTTPPPPESTGPFPPPPLPQFNQSLNQSNVLLYPPIPDPNAQSQGGVSQPGQFPFLPNIPNPAFNLFPPQSVPNPNQPGLGQQPLPNMGGNQPQMPNAQPSNQGQKKQPYRRPPPPPPQNQNQAKVSPVNQPYQSMGNTQQQHQGGVPGYQQQYYQTIPPQSHQQQYPPYNQFPPVYQPQYSHPSQTYYGGVPPTSFDMANMVSQVVNQQQQQTQCIVSRQSKANQLPSFGGDPRDWPLFHQRYLQSTRDCNYRPTENIARLADCLKGEALRHVQPLLFTLNTSPDDIISRLQRRYGKPDQIVQTLEKAVEDLPEPKKHLHTILDFSSHILNYVHTVKTLGVSEYLHNPKLLTRLVNKLPENLQISWGETYERIASPNLDHFSTWLDAKANAISNVTTPNLPTGGSAKLRRESTFATTSSPPAKKTESKPEPTKPSQYRCPTCKGDQKGDHKVAACPDYRGLTVDQRWNKAKELKLCFRCLQPRCNLSVCRSKKLCGVEGCNRRHHSLLHGSTVAAAKPREEQSAPPRKVVREMNGHLNEPFAACPILLRVVPVTIHGPGGEMTINALLDEASTVTMISQSVADKLGLKGPVDPLRLNWTNGASQTDNSSRNVKLHISPVNSKQKYKMEGVKTVRNLDLPAQLCDYEEILKSHAHLKGVSIKVMTDVKPAMLIGQPHIQLTVARAIREGDPSAPVATETRLGWVLHGPTGSRVSCHHMFVCYHETDEEILHRLVKESFSMESVGIRSYSNSRSREDVAAELIMERVTRRVGDRWETGLLWRKEPAIDDAVQVQAQQPAEVSDIRPTVSPCRRGRSTSIGGGVAPGREALELDSVRGSASLRVGQGCPFALPGTSALPPSYATAYSRLLGVDRRLTRDESLKAQFKAKLDHYMDMGYARKLTEADAAKPTPKQWFLPIFPVFNPNKPGKLRLVWDAASLSHGKSLNDFLHTGPDLLVSLPGLLLNFRRKKIAFSGDINEMFYRVLIRPEDQPAQRILWRDDKDAKPDVFQLQIMMFGAVCSPYCAQYVKNKNAEEFAVEFPAAANAIIKRHYMDDYVDCTDTEEEAIALIRNVTEVHRRGGFHIAKWISNSSTVLQSIEPDDRVPAAKDLSLWSEIPTERALGLHWNPKDDHFMFKLNVNRAGDGIATGEKVPTKRAILRLVMLVWDPLGFLNHFMIKARILLQHVWRSQVEWDDEIPLALYEVWRKWARKLPKIEEIRIPRCYSPSLSTSENVQLHVFFDASQQACCAVAYLRISTANGVETRFLMSKSRVAPLKPTSIPRLELQAALLASRLGKFIVETFEVPIKSVHYWSDSATVLKWIRNEARRFQLFVCNRIGEIHENSEVGSWRWVPSKENPADEGTRERKCDLSNESWWWTGPKFLSGDVEDWPEEAENEFRDQAELPELNSEFAAVIVQQPNFDHLPSLKRFSNYMRLLRATAYVIDACDRFRGRSHAMLPQARAETLLIIRSQWEDFSEGVESLKSTGIVPTTSKLYKLSPLLDHNGVIRMKSRLASAQEEGIRMPIILPQKNPLTRLLILYQHKISCHQGEEFVRNELRQRFWIPHLRAAIRSVLLIGV